MDIIIISYGRTGNVLRRRGDHRWYSLLYCTYSMHYAIISSSGSTGVRVLLHLWQDRYYYRIYPPFIKQNDATVVLCCRVLRVGGTGVTAVVLALLVASTPLYMQTRPGTYSTHHTNSDYNRVHVYTYVLFFVCIMSARRIAGLKAAYSLNITVYYYREKKYCIWFSVPFPKFPWDRFVSK